MLDKANWEVYCQERAKGRGKSASARNAGFTERSAGVQANRLEKKAEVISRIKELKDRASSLAVSSIGLSKEWVLKELADLHQIAKVRGQVTPATRCVELIGKELGMFQDVIPREIYNLMMAAMGSAVSHYVSDPAVLERIIESWEQIAIAEPRQLRAGIIKSEQ